MSIKMAADDDEAASRRVLRDVVHACAISDLREAVDILRRHRQQQQQQQRRRTVGVQTTHNNNYESPFADRALLHAARAFASNVNAAWQVVRCHLSLALSFGLLAFSFTFCTMVLVNHLFMFR